MGLVEANTSFDHAGKQVKAGDVIDTTHYLYLMFPTRFSPVSGVVSYGAGTVVGTVGTSAGTLGSLIAKAPVSNPGGTVIGYTAYYDTIT